jgi:ketosteroid isomerase-like protein
MQKLLLSFIFGMMLFPAQGQTTTLKKDFKTTIVSHVHALEEKNLADLAATVDDSVTLIFPDGVMYKTMEKYLQFHNAWFKKGWELSPEILHTDEGPNLAYALVKYKYSRYNPDKSEKSISNTYLLLIFKKRKDLWLLVHEQNTKIQ